jgi:16S rRNA (uracil1498-N3)-methyltransferase
VALDVRRSAAAHVFVADLDGDNDGGELALSEEDAHHLARVLRVKADEVVTASDGQGRWRACRLRLGQRPAPGPDAVHPTLVPTGPVEHEPRPAPAIAVGFALTKGDKPEWAVQKLTEAGVDVIAPFVAARSVVRWDADKAERHHARLVRVAREAAMQSRRVWLPTVLPVADFAGAAAAVEAAVGAAPVLAEPGGGPVSLAHPAVLIGPEGGWAPEEAAAVRGRIALGHTVLRAETAALAAGVLLCAIRDRIVEFHDR